MAAVGVPIKLLHESAGHIITCELTNGCTYRGRLLDAEDSMNLQISHATCTARDGKLTQLEQVYIRGSHVRFIIVPDMLKNAPMFKNIGVGGISRGRGLGAFRSRGMMPGGRGGAQRGRY